MSEINSKPPRRWWLVGLAVAALLIVASLWWQSQQVAVPAPVATATPPATDAPANSASPATGMDAASFEAQQQAAADAAARQVGQKPITGPITERPEFVSEVEWQVLKGVASQKPNSDKELTRMVNQLRFEKQEELWRSMAGSGDPAQRHALAQQLLDEIPERVSNKEMDLAEAQKLQYALLSDLVSDPNERRQRASDEVKRLTPTAAE